jgi:cephalosporin-C deacetylase
MNREIRAFWDRTLAELRGLDSAPTLEPVADKEDGPFEVQWVTLSSFEGRRIRGRYYVPSDPPHRGRFPALLTVPGYSGFNMTPPPVHMAMAGFAVLALFPRYQGPTEDERRLPHGTKLTYHIADPERFSYRGAYMDCVRGVDFLAGRPEVDPERIGMWGTSQGGGLTLATAALDGRIAAAAADLPFLCNYPVAIDVARGPYGELYRYVREHPDQRAPMLETLAYFDPVSLAGEIACPTIISIGARDEVCPPATIQPVFNRIRALKSLIVYPERAHAGDTDFFQHALAWLKRYLAV